MMRLGRAEEGGGKAKEPCGTSQNSEAPTLFTQNPLQHDRRPATQKFEWTARFIPCAKGSLLAGCRMLFNVGTTTVAAHFSAAARICAYASMGDCFTLAVMACH